VQQEPWGILFACNLVRVEMERIADEAHVEPTRIRFVMALHLICDEWIRCANASPGAIPRHLRNLRRRGSSLHPAAETNGAKLPARREDRDEPLPAHATGRDGGSLK